MPFLLEADIEFARNHIERYYDTDFFPKHYALACLWHRWDDVKSLLLSKSARELPLSTPQAMVWPKPKGGYRVVHQLDPLSSVAYTALIHHVAKEVERSRQPRSEHVACSYRISISDGSFFASGTGYDEFQERTKSLANDFPFVLATDISDFYNQIYLHRIRNAISTSGDRMDAKAEEIERLLMKWTSSNSQGIPVGPAASIILSEAVLIDVDQYLRNQGVFHTRYVDDFRIFGTSLSSLLAVQRSLTIYLYETHRLHLAAEKTSVSSSTELIERVFENPYEVEKIEIFEDVSEIFNPYTQELEQIIEETGHEDAKVLLNELMERVLNLPTLELGLARAIIRRAKGISTDILVPKIFEGLPKLIPVINDVFLYLHAVCWPDDKNSPIKLLEAAVESQISEEPAFRVWADWFITGNPAYSLSPKLRKYVLQSDNPISRARLAVIERDTAWIRDHKNRFSALTPEARLATIFASPTLAKDEREPWLRNLASETSHATTIEKWMAKTALDGAVNHSFADDDLPF